MKKGNVPTLPQVSRMTNLETLQKTMDRLARRSNDRLLKLERAGMDASSPAYRAAMDMLDGNRFSRSKNLTAGQIRKEIEKNIRFLNMQTSSVRGENQRIEKVFNTLKDEALIDANVDEQKFAEFLKSPACKELKSIDSSQIMGEASVAIANGKSVEDLIASYEEYLRGESEADNLLEVFEGWTEVPFGEDPFSIDEM